MRRWIVTAGVVCSLVLCLGATAGTIYKVVKADGTVIFTDRPVEGAVPVQVTPQNTVSMQNAAPKATRSTKPALQRLPDYQLAIKTPANEQTIRNNNGDLNIAGEMSPTGNGVFQLFMNGVIADTQPVPVFTLSGVDRGEHSIQIKFLHNSGKILASTPVHKVFMHRASALTRPN